MRGQEILFSSKSDEWATPQELYDQLDQKYLFTIDVAATEENTKCDYYLDKSIDGLTVQWYGRCFLNPPYSNVKEWVKKAHEETASGNASLVVCLLPVRTDTKWFHEYVIPYAEVEFIKGRLKFGDAKNSAPFPSMIAIFRSPRNAAP